MPLMRSQTYSYDLMEDVIEIISEAAEPVIDTLQDWGTDVVDYVKNHAPQYLRYAVYALKHIHI